MGSGGVNKDGGMTFLGIELKWISLITLALQNAFLTIIMHYSRITASPARTYSAASAVLVNELLKGTISLLIALKRVDNEMSRVEGHRLSPAFDGGRKGLDGEPSPIRTSRLSPSSTRGGGGGGGSGGAGAAGSAATKWSKYIAPYGKASRWRRLYSDILSPDCWKLSIPAILYVIQNNLQYVAASNLDVATFQVTYQMKILTTAFFSVIMLRKRLSAGKWLALLLLAVGVGIVQIQSGNAGHHGAGTTTTSHGIQEHLAQGLGSHDRNDMPIPGAAPDFTEDAPPLALESQQVDHVPGHEMHRLTGFAAVSAACLTSGLAGVYFEMVLKGSKADLWTRNVQLSLFSLVPALMPVLFQSGRSGGSGGGMFSILLDPFRNFSMWAWGTVLTQVFGGLITALVIKYSDNILKGFATSLSIVISFLASVGLFAYPITPAFVLGSSIVLAATWMYNQPGETTARTAAAAASGGNASSSGYGGGRRSMVDQDGTLSRISVAVPGSPIPANAPIIGEAPKPSRASSFVSLLGLTTASRASSRSQTPSAGLQHSQDSKAQQATVINGMYTSMPPIPPVNSSNSDVFGPSYSQSVPGHQYGYAWGPHHGQAGNGINPATTITGGGGSTSPVRTKESAKRR